MEKDTSQQSITSGKLAFKSEPKKGHIHVYHDQIFSLLAVDGRIILWQSFCATCGEAFTTRSGFVSNSVTRRCNTCIARQGKTPVKTPHPASCGYATHAPAVRKAKEPKETKGKGFDPKTDAGFQAFADTPFFLKEYKKHVSNPNTKQSWHEKALELYEQYQLD